LTAIDTWIHKQLKVPINQNLGSSFLESTVSHRFNLERRAQKLFDILKDEDHEAQLSSDAIFLSILLGQAGINLTEFLLRQEFRSISSLDHTNNPAYYTILQEFLTDPARAGPHFFNDDKFARLTENVLRFIIKR